MIQGTAGTKARAKKLRREMSLPEVLLWQRLRARPNGLKFRKQHDAGALPQPVFRLRRTHQALKLAAFCRRQDNSCRFRDTAHAPLNHDSFFSDSGY